MFKLLLSHNPTHWRREVLPESDIDLMFGRTSPRHAVATGQLFPFRLYLSGMGRDVFGRYSRALRQCRNRLRGITFPFRRLAGNHCAYPTTVSTLFPLTFLCTCTWTEIRSLISCNEKLLLFSFLASVIVPTLP